MASSMNAAEGEGKRVRVLIAEDDEDLAETFAIWLGGQYDVTVRRDRASAVGAVDETYDVALLDRRLPDGTGAEVLTEIRDRDIDCRVAMVTGVEPDFDIVEMGFDEYLRKPVSKDVLLGLVERLLVQSELDDSLRRTYRLARKKGLLEAEYPTRTLADSEEYAELGRRIEALKWEVDAQTAELSPRQLAATMGPR